MTQVVPTLVFGVFAPNDWISRYCRFRVDLPAGRHRLTGAVFNPDGDDLVDNRLLAVADRTTLGEVAPAPDSGWNAFSFDLPAMALPGGIDIVLRTARFRTPPPPDERILGLILKDFVVELDTVADAAAEAAAAVKDTQGPNPADLAGTA